MPSSLTPGSSHIACVQLRDADAAFAEIRAARHSQDSRNPFHAGPVFRGFTGSHCYGLSGCSPPWTDRTRFPWSTGGFYIQASGGSVALPAAGYDYNSNWTSSVGGTFTRKEWQLASLHQIRERADLQLSLVTSDSSYLWDDCMEVSHGGRLCKRPCLA